MLIEGQPFQFTTFEAALAKLIALPSAFPAERTKVSTVIRGAKTKAFHLNQQGLTAYNEGRASADKETIKERFETAREAFNKAAEKSARGNDIAHARYLANYGYVAILLGDNAAAVPALEKASELHLRTGSLDFYYDDIGFLYEALHNLSKQPHDNPEEIKQKMAAVREKALWALENRDHEPVNPDAYPVEQNEIGFSDKAPIGADNICDCVCVMVRDPLTHKTAVAHIDYSTGIDSLQSLFDRMPANTPLEVKLVGACFGASDQESIENMKKVTDFLLTKDNVDILSTDIYNSYQQRSLVVDPETFAVTEQRPGKGNPDKHLCNGLPMIGEQGKPLHVAFDLTQSPERAPHLLTQNEIGNIHRYRRQTPQEFYEDSKALGATLTQSATRTEIILRIIKAHQDAVNHLLEIVDQQIAEKAKSGIRVIPGQRNDIEDALNQIPLHIGTGADVFNSPLENCIRNSLFTAPEEGDLCHVDISDLHAVRLDVVPYEKIETRAKRQSTSSPRSKTEAHRP